VRGEKVTGLSPLTASATSNAWIEGRGWQPPVQQSRRTPPCGCSTPKGLFKTNKYLFPFFFFVPCGTSLNETAPSELREEAWPGPSGFLPRTRTMAAALRSEETREARRAAARPLRWLPALRGGKRQNAGA